jgi:hypothetical protein
MPKITVYKVPALDKGQLIQLEKQGYAVNLYVGDVQERFMLQLDSNGAPDCLVHYATAVAFSWSQPTAAECLSRTTKPAS